MDTGCGINPDRLRYRGHHILVSAASGCGIGGFRWWYRGLHVLGSRASGFAIGHFSSGVGAFTSRGGGGHVAGYGPAWCRVGVLMPWAPPVHAAGRVPTHSEVDDYMSRGGAYHTMVWSSPYHRVVIQGRRVESLSPSGRKRHFLPNLATYAKKTIDNSSNSYIGNQCR